MKLKNRIPTIVHNSMFSVMSLVLAFLGNLTLFPVFPFLKADLSDMPIYLATLVLGIPSGITVLLTVSIIRMLLFSASGWIGFIIRITTTILIIFLGIIQRYKLSKFFNIMIICVGIIICLIVKLSLNYFFWINFFSISKECLSSLLWSIILPYNIAKILFSVFIAFYVKEKYIKERI